MPAMRHRSLNNFHKKWDNNLKTEKPEEKLSSGRSRYQMIRILERNRFGRALANAGTAFDAFVTDFGNAVFDGDSTDRAGTNASFATDALFFVNFSSHLIFLLQKILRNK